MFILGGHFRLKSYIVLSALIWLITVEGALMKS